MSSSHAPPHVGCPLLLTPQEFAHDAEQRLGRANGNTYQRRPPLENTHDGQIMVRLKKKRFIIIDYGIVPTPQDLNIVKNIPYVVVPEGAGERLCATRNCPRIGVPVQLYDSEPNEPASLYLRGGLCFSCQRNLNEKRRTQRKRKSDTIESHPSELHQHQQQPHHPASNSSSSQHQQQRYRLNGSLLDLNPDAVIINGAIEGTRTRGPDYQYPRIGPDLLHLVSEIHRGSHALLSMAYRAQSMGTVGQPSCIGQINDVFQSTFRDLSRATYLITQWKASWDENLGGNMLAASSGAGGAVSMAATLAASVSMNKNNNSLGVEDSNAMGGVASSSVKGLANDAVSHEGQHLQQQQQQEEDEEDQDEEEEEEEEQRANVNALMAPAAARRQSLQGGGEEKNGYDLSEFYEEV